MRRAIPLEGVLALAGLCVALSLGAIDATAGPVEASSVAGVIQDSKGRPIPGVWIECEGYRRLWRSDAHGRFRIDFPPAGPVTLRVRAGEKSLALPPTRTVETKAGVSDLRIVLDPRRQIFVRIAEYEPNVFSETRWARLVWLEPDGTRPVRYAPIRSDGWTRFVALPDDREFELWAQATLSRFVRQGGLRPGEDEQRIAPSEVRDIAGTVRAGSYALKSIRVTVYAYPPLQGSPAAPGKPARPYFPGFIVDRGRVNDGAFGMYGLPLGTYKVEVGVDGGGGKSISKDVEAGTTDAVFDLGR